MGYNLHITRKENWSDDDDSSEISLHEWISYVEGDHEMEMESTAAALTKDGEPVEFESLGLAFWRNYSRHGINRTKARFFFHKGQIEAKNPDVEIRNKMIAVAASLQAKVQGDDGEEYNEVEPVQQEPWWKFW